MDGNKDEAQRCIDIARLALESGDKRKALKFITIAQRLYPRIQVEELLAACGDTQECRPNCESESAAANQVKRETAESVSFGGGDQNYTEEHARLIREIKRHRDYYAILGVEKSCSAEEIRKAYRKLSLKVHPDKNKAPGSEEAFKTVSMAFKCLSDSNSRMQYDQTGFIDDFKFNPLHTNTRRRRQRATRDDFFHENFDSDEIFTSFFFGGGENGFRTQHVHRTRHMPRQQRETTNAQGGEFSFSSLLHFLPILLIFLFAYLHFSEPDYSLQKAYNFQIGKVTEKYGVEYYVSSSEFDQKFPQGSPSRVNLEYNVIRDYKNTISRFCRVELQRRQWYKNYPTPHCDRLRSFGVS